MQINSQLINRWVRNLEVGATVIWLLYFMDVNLPPPFSQFAKTLSYPFIGILVVLRWKRLTYVATREIPLLLFIGTALASVLWTASLGATLDGIRGLFRSFLFGAYIASRYSIKEQMKIWIWVFGIAAVLSLAVSIAVPSYGIELAHSSSGIDSEGWKGIFPYKNFMGYTMSIGAILFLLTALKDRKQNWLAWIGFSLTVVLTVLAHSAASLLTIAILLSLLPLYQLVKQHYKLRVILLGIIFFLIITVFILIVSNLETILVDILGKGLEFDGRVPIWNLAIEKGLEQSWLGYGYNAFWKSDAGFYVMIHTWSGIREAGFNTHNSYIETFLSLGFVGISLYAISLVTAFIKLMNLLISTKKLEFFWLFQLLMFTCISSVADSYELTLVYISISLSVAVEYEYIIKKRNLKEFSILFKNS